MPKALSLSLTTTCRCQFSCLHKCLSCPGEHPNFINFLIPAFIIIFFNPSVHTTHVAQTAVAAHCVKPQCLLCSFSGPLDVPGHLCVGAWAVRGVGASFLAGSHSQNNPVCFTHACLPSWRLSSCERRRENCLEKTGSSEPDP